MIKQSYSYVVSEGLTALSVNVMALKGLRHGTKTIMCDICGQEYSEDAVLLFRGRYYCRATCWHDIRSILLLEKGPRKPFNRKPEEVGAIIFSNQPSTATGMMTLVGGWTITTSNGEVITLAG